MWFTGVVTTPRTDDEIMDVLEQTVVAVRAAFSDLESWGLAGTRAGQYHSDLAADAAATAVLDAAGFGVLSEESGIADLDRELIAIIDPLDGSTNASRGLPWFACSLCVVDSDGPRVALVVDLAHDVAWSAVRGGGARRNGETFRRGATPPLRDAVVALSGLPPRWLGWKQYRAYGAAALDLCNVAYGVVDAYIDCSRNAHGVWDYAGALLVCQEAGAPIVDAFDRDLIVLDHDERRTPIAAGSPELLAEVLEQRRTF